jgi:hypothetical protein
LFQRVTSCAAGRVHMCLKSPMRRIGVAFLLLFFTGTASAQGNLTCSQRRVIESIHSDIILTFVAEAGQRYSFESTSLDPPHSIDIHIWRGQTYASAEVVLSSDPARICDWEAPETGMYTLIQVHSGGTFAISMHCGVVPEGCTSTSVRPQTWARVKSLFR